MKEPKEAAKTMSLGKTDIEASYTSGGEESHKTVADDVISSTTPPPDTTKEAIPQDEAYDDDDFPDGGLRAWLVIAGGASIFFCCLGFGNSFGTFEAYYLAHQLKGQSPDNIAWIGSVSAFLPFATGVLGGPLFDRYGAKVCFFFVFSSSFLTFFTSC